jgi:predicted nucleotidyltransferase component of viral defense system
MSKVNQARSIASKLSNISQAEGITYQNIATAFLIERLLARLILNSDLTKCLIFKGGYVGLRVYNSARYTIDLDALLVKADIPSTLKQTVSAIETDIGDGTWFVLESQTDLRTQGEYGGFRQTFRAGIGEQPKDIKRSQVICFDLGVGDPVTPGPIRTQTAEMIGGGELSWRVYPIETIIAEKLQTLVVRGGDNSRAKDVFDLHYYLPKADIKTLKIAVNKCFEFRETQMPSDLGKELSKIDQSLLKRGWKSAMLSIRNAPTFEEAFENIVDAVERIFPGDESKPRARK